MAIDLTGIHGSTQANDAQVNDLRQNKPLQTDPKTAAGPSNTSDTSDKGEASQAESDSVTLTQTVSVLQDLQQNLSKLAVVDSSRVAAVQNALANGSFEINSDRIAEKMLAFEQSLAPDL